MNLVTATDIAQWSERRDAQHTLPQVVRRLISATNKSILRLSVRAGEGVALPGWDGVAETPEASLFVPSGLSVWEMGVGGSPKEKADDDYSKRTKSPGEIYPSTTTFVFVTARRWRDKEAWAAERRKEGVWKDVVAIDADDIETWLEIAPAVHAWLSSQMGRSPYEVESLEVWWQEWSASTSPEFPTTLLLSGREAQTKELLEFLSSQAGATTLSADSQNEAIAFIASALARKGLPGPIERTILVHTPGALKQLVHVGQPLLLLPTFENPSATQAVRLGHHVIRPTGPEEVSLNGIQLPRLRREGIEAALSGAGLPPGRASTLATLGRRSLLSLRRQLAVNPDFEVPAWARAENPSPLLAAVLSGAWQDSSEGDRAAISALAGMPYEDVARDLTRWLQVSDPPLRRVGDIWMVAAKEDSWALLARYLTSDDLERYRNMAITVLGADDPSLELPSEQRAFASMLGRTSRYSGHLTQGLAGTLALMASATDTIRLAGGRRGAQEAAHVVRSLLEACNEDATGRRWQSLAPVLPLLAEAAPVQFLEAIEAGTQASDGPTLSLFQDGAGSDNTWSSSPHVHLLWALETLAWTPQYLPRATLCLAKLARFEPGGRTLNRPANSLRHILLLWRPNTTASLDERLQVIDLLREHEPGLAWELMLNLVPVAGEHSSSTAAPKFRDWKPDHPVTESHIEEVQGIEAVVDRLISDAASDGSRWARLLERVATLPLQARERVIDSLEELEPNELAPDGLKALCRRLIDIKGQHRKGLGAAWAMPEPLVDRLDAITSALQPRDALSMHEWLFLPGAIYSFPGDGDDHVGQDHALRTAQDAALITILKERGLDEFADWVLTSTEPSFSASEIALTLARSEEIDPSTVLEWFASDHKHRRDVAAYYFRNLGLQNGPSWSVSTVMGMGNTWPDVVKAAALALLAAEPEIIAAIEKLPADAEAVYWKSVSPFALPTEGESVTVVVNRLLATDLPRRAIEYLSRPGPEILSQVGPELIATVLEAAATTATEAFDDSSVRSIGKLLDWLYESKYVVTRLAQLEWVYLPLFRYSNRQSRALHRSLAESPQWFADVIGFLYPPADDQDAQPSEEEQIRARTAYDLLASWRLVPGISADGSLDETQLIDWVTEARSLLSISGRLTQGDHWIGRVLRYGPPPQEPVRTVEAGDAAPPSRVIIWPAEAIRKVVETTQSSHLERGFRQEVMNSRGATFRGLTDGGQQERELADYYRRCASYDSMRWPRTTSILVEIAEAYDREAEEHDREAELTEDTWR